MENISPYNPTLDKIAADFLLGLAPQDKEKTQIQVYRFIRWFGSHRTCGSLNPVEIASYAEQITPLEAKPLKSFLTYMRQKGLTTITLAVHLRPKKASSKLTTRGQSLQEQTTLTPEGHAKLKAELVNLQEQRTDIIEQIKRASADKDFRENAPLAAAREQKSCLEGRIQDLESALKLVKIIGEHQHGSKAKMGDTVVLCELPSGKKLDYTLVDSREADPAQGKLSIISPLGRILLHKEKGQVVEITAPAGMFRYRIEDIQGN